MHVDCHVQAKKSVKFYVYFTFSAFETLPLSCSGSKQLDIFYKVEIISARHVVLFILGKDLGFRSDG